MTTLFLFMMWCGLAVLCWPVAILALILMPLIWLVALPFRLLGVVVSAGFILLRTLLLLPSRLLGYRPL